MDITSKQFKELVIKSDLKALEEKLPTRKQIDNLTTAVDSLALAVKNMTDEHHVLRSRVKRVEKHVGIVH